MLMQHWQWLKSPRGRRLVLRFVSRDGFCSHVGGGGGWGWPGGLALAVGFNAGLVLSELAVCLSRIFSLSLLATARGGASFLGP
jgi:hypothetical protein